MGKLRIAQLAAGRAGAVWLPSWNLKSLARLPSSGQRVKWVLLLCPFIDEEMEALTVPSHSQLGRDRKEILTREGLTPSCDLSHQVTPISLLLSLPTTHWQKSPRSPTTRTTGLARKPQDTQRMKTQISQSNLVEDRGRTRKGSIPGVGPEVRMGKQGLPRGDWSRSTAISRALGPWPLPLGQKQRS